MGPGFRRYDVSEFVGLKTVIPAQAGTHTTLANTTGEKKPGSFRNPVF